MVVSIYEDECAITLPSTLPITCTLPTMSVSTCACGGWVRMSGESCKGKGEEKGEGEG